MSADEVTTLLDKLGISSGCTGGATGVWLETTGAEIDSINPATGASLGKVRGCEQAQ